MNEMKFKEKLFHIEGLIDAPSKDYLSSTLELLGLYSYRVEEEEVYMKRLEDEKKIIGVVTPCHNSNFQGINCLEDKERYGFFNSNNDIRPGHVTWIKKEKAEKLYSVLKIEGVLIDE